MAKAIIKIEMVDEDVLDGEYDEGEGPLTPRQIAEALVQLDPDDRLDVLASLSELHNESEMSPY
jgi:hypothetical protein